MKMASFLTTLLDEQFTVFGIKFGIDPLLDFIPGIGNFIGVGISLYLVWIGKQMNIPNEALFKMIRNIILDFLLGIIPILGEFADVAFRSNSKNLAILRTYYPQRIIDGTIVSDS